MFQKKEILISLFNVYALMTGCTGEIKSNGNSAETTIQEESTTAEITVEQAKETNSVTDAEKMRGITESSELSFPIGQEIQSDSFTGTSLYCSGQRQPEGAVCREEGDYGWHPKEISPGACCVSRTAYR